MKPIINPWIIYFAEVSEYLKGMIFTTSVFVIFFTGIILLIAWINEKPEKEFIDLKKGSIKIICLAFIGITLATFIPSRQTLFKMVLLDNITTENIEGFKGGAKDLIDYINETSQIKGGSEE